jgi:hypothetical protein
MDRSSKSRGLERFRRCRLRFMLHRKSLPVPQLLSRLLPQAFPNTRAQSANALDVDSRLSAILCIVVADAMGGPERRRCLDRLPSSVIPGLAQAGPAYANAITMDCTSDRAS